MKRIVGDEVEERQNLIMSCSQVRLHIKSFEELYKAPVLCPTRSLTSRGWEKQYTKEPLFSRPPG